MSCAGCARRGGASGEHADGWGLASFTPGGHPDHPSLTLLREKAPAAFSALADQLAERSPRALVALENCHPLPPLWQHRQRSSALFEQLHSCAAALAERGTFNALISNGKWLFATATSRLIRRSRWISTEPLTTDEHWQPFQAGESLLFRAGEVSQRSRHAIWPTPAH